nr:hypothetical protein GCM10020093_013650 [Planobispora longispora]
MVADLRQRRGARPDRGVHPRGPGHVLITSRNPHWENHFETLQVDVFDREESLEFLRKRLHRDIPAKDSSVLADRLGDLPLALEQAGALQYETGMAIDEYIEQLDRQTRNLLSANRAPGYPMSMTAAWRVSVSLLEDRLPEAIKVLRCCAFFGPEPIPRDVFRRGNQVLLREDGPGASQLAAVLSDPIMLSKTLGELRRFALARIDPETRTIQVHRLVQALLRDDLPEEERAKARHEVHLLLAGAAPASPETTGKWSEFNELVAHIIPSGLAECTDPRVREFALNSVRYLYQAGSYQPALGFVDEFIGRWTAADGPRHKDVLVARVHRGNILRGSAGTPRTTRAPARPCGKCGTPSGPSTPRPCGRPPATGAPCVPAVSSSPPGNWMRKPWRLMSGFSGGRTR